MEKLYDYFLSLDRVCVAFSGGVDSAVVLKVAVDSLGTENVMAVFIQSNLSGCSDLHKARRVADEMSVNLTVLEIDGFKNEKFLQNGRDRCYICKFDMFSKLVKLADSRGIKTVADGTNADDMHSYRPGIAALTELNIISPLRDLGYTKANVRELARILGLSVAQRPSSPCLATRIPYGTRITPELLNKIEQAENYINNMGVRQCRVRAHGDIARIEVESSDINLILNDNNLASRFHEIGFNYITLDLEWFRSGSMDLF